MINVYALRKRLEIQDYTIENYNIPCFGNYIQLRLQVKSVTRFSPWGNFNPFVHLTRWHQHGSLAPRSEYKSRRLCENAFYISCAPPHSHWMFDGRVHAGIIHLQHSTTWCAVIWQVCDAHQSRWFWPVLPTRQNYQLCCKFPTSFTFLKQTLHLIDNFVSYDVYFVIALRPQKLNQVKWSTQIISLG